MNQTPTNTYESSTISNCKPSSKGSALENLGFGQACCCAIPQCVTMATYPLCLLHCRCGYYWNDELH